LTTFVALLRSINVGGRNRLPMADLRGLADSLGFGAVHTYLQSGNVVFTGTGSPSTVARSIETRIAGDFGLDVPVIVRSKPQWARILGSHPYAGPGVDPATVHVTFLADPPDEGHRTALAEVAATSGPDGPFGDDRFALAGADVWLDFPSVGATENLITAAASAKGVTIVENAAREPEITDLCAFLNRMGAHILGAGSSTLEIEGSEELVAVDSELMGDRIEAGTLIMACGIAGGEIELTGVRPEHLELVTLKLGEMGMRVSPTPDGLWAHARSRLRAVDVATLPFPGFATDFMPMIVALLAVADGTAIVTENVYDGRFQFIDELARMGADVRNEGRHAVVRGVARLSGAPVQASDVRAGAALTIAGLAADGETIVHACEHVDRGYPDLPGQLRALGADVTRLPN